MARILVLDELGVYCRGLCALISTQIPQAQVLAAKSLIEALPQFKMASSIWCSWAWTCTTPKWSIR